MSQLFSYCAYGLKIVSSMPLPELTPAANDNLGTDHILISERPIQGLPSRARETGYHVGMHAQTAYLYTGTLGAVQVQEGRAITLERISGASDKIARLFLLGPGLAMAMHQRGSLVLHASSVALRTSNGGHEAAAFLGESGQGKSTFAACLYERGNRVIADDVTPIPPASLTPAGADSPSAPLIYPGFPTLKLWPLSANALYRDQEAPPLIDPTLTDYPRREKQAVRDFSLDPLPLSRLYVLEEADTLEIVPMSRAEGLMSLIRNSYWIADMNPAQQAEHFEQCQSVIDRVKLYYLRRPRDLNRLQEVASLVEDHIAGGG